MKAPVLALSLAAAAFAGSSLYLWQQLAAERQRAAQVEATTSQLQARIAELEKARAQFAHVRDGNGPAISGAFGNAVPPDAAVAASATADDAGEREPAWSVQEPPQRHAAMDKMMRWHIRGNQKRMYADVGTELGIGKEEASKLVDLLTEQQMTMSGISQDLPWDSDPVEAQRRMAEKQRADQAEIDALLGPEKALALKEYQRSLPARQEFEMLARQLEGIDATLSPEQSSKLLAVYLEQRRRAPMPEYNDIRDTAAFQKAFLDWQENNANRILDEARTILNPSQLAAFSELQDLQREMRSQVNAITVNTAQGGTIALQSGAVGFSAVTAVAAPTSAVPVAPPPPPRETKRER